MKLVDLAHLNWTTTHNGGVSYGCYYKATEIKNGKKYYYKCSNFYSNNKYFGDESANEVICSRLLRILGFDCVKYTLVYALVKIKGNVYKTYVCKSENFFVQYSSRATLEDMHDVYDSLSVNDLVVKLGIQKQVKHMLIADFITLQRDRHGGNIELLCKNNKWTMSPLFDNGLGLLAPFPSKSGMSIEAYDILADIPVNNYIGTRSLYENLRYIDRPIKVTRLTKADKSRIFYGLHDALPKEYIDKIWKLITYRYMFLRQRGFIDDQKV